MVQLHLRYRIRCTEPFLPTNVSDATNCGSVTANVRYLPKWLAVEVMKCQNNRESL